MPPKKHDLPAGFSANPAPYNFSPDNGVTLTLGMLGTGVAALVVGTISIVSFGFSWSGKMDKMSDQIDMLTKIVWTVPDAREMVHRIRRDNPTLIVPDPAEIHRTIHDSKP
jgi:hypothetical protein